MSTLIEGSEFKGTIVKSVAAAADSITASLLATYNVDLTKDWKHITALQSQKTFPFIVFSKQWKSGRWTMAELQTVEEALGDLAELMGGASHFRSLIGTRITKVSLTPRACGRGCTRNNGRRVDFLDKGDPAKTVDIQNKHNIDKWTIVHEFGHVWDGRHGWALSAGLEAFTHGSTGGARPLDCDKNSRRPGCNKAGYFYGGVPPRGSDINFNRREDFAESVAAAVYPAAAEAAVKAFEGTAMDFLHYSKYKGSERWNYVNKLIAGTLL